MTTRHTDMRAGFSERAMVALALAIVVGISVEMLQFLVGYTSAFALSTTGAASMYAIWLVVRSRERRALLLISACWIASILMLLALMLSPVLHVAVLLAMLWLLRALYLYRRPLQAMLDVVVVGFAGMAGFWAFIQTGSAAAATWSVLLVMAILIRLPDRPVISQTNSSSTDRFDRARTAADQAVSSLSQV